MILPLPDEVIAQIKSSTAIVSLKHVVIELLKNSLDAKAGQVDLSVDTVRGGCTVEDDGQGIPPFEFGLDGGLGKFYCTSKYHSHEASLGRNGTFLASLAAVSLVTITSRHYQHRSTNAISFHHSKIIERQLPASAHSQLHTKNGTRVTVRNLFGNLPVRVKHRAMMLGQKSKHDQLWGALRKEIVALLLSWQGKVSLRVRDGHGRLNFNLNTSTTIAEVGGHKIGISNSRSARLSSVLGPLTQANYISIDDWASWVPVSACTSLLSVEGAISLRPAPSKNVQFISFGIRPLLAESGHNEVIDQVNRLFALSAFGTTDSQIAMDELQAACRSSDDKRYMEAEYTDRQLRGHKDVDRHPMFHLSILLNSDSNESASKNQNVESEANLHTIVEVVSAVITQWLSIHHFNPKSLRKKRSPPSIPATSSSEIIKTNDAILSESVFATASYSAPRRTSSSGSAAIITGRRESAANTKSKASSDKVHRGAFAQWSRIKSGKAEFSCKLPIQSKPQKTALIRSHQPVCASNTSCAGAEDLPGFDVGSIPQGAFNQGIAQGKTSEADMQPCDSGNREDETICWIDPISKKSFMLNARTGGSIPNDQFRTSTESPSLFVNQNDFNKSLRLVPKPKKTGTGTSPWLDGMLRDWDNPVFKPGEQEIERTLVLGQETENEVSHRPLYCYTHVALNKIFHEAAVLNRSKLSKEALMNAQVIAQVDQKFILVTMEESMASAPEKVSTGLLVLIDQHAADERVQVEALFQELCMPVATDTPHGVYQSKLGYKGQITSAVLEKPLQFSISVQEQTQFITHAARFAAWGILYDIPGLAASKEPDGLEKDQLLLSLTALPPVIATRCQADPKLVVSLLRSTVWQFASDHNLPSPAPPIPPLGIDNTSWLRRLATCPPALIDLINSRACRSAIMFNDILSFNECEALVRRLADCVFPFMCAHGRPSMVPMLNLGPIMHDKQDNMGMTGEESFARAWKSWNK